MTTKLHPSIVITRKPSGYAEVSVQGETHRTHCTPESVDSYAAEVSGILWSIEVSEKPAKPRPTRIWDDEGYATF